MSRRSILTTKQLDFLKENVSGRSYDELTDMLNKRFDTQFSRKQIKNFLKRRKLNNAIQKRKRHYPLQEPPQEHIAFLTEHIKECSYMELTDKFNKHFNLQLTFNQIRHMLERYKIRNGRGKVSYQYSQEQIDFLKENSEGRLRRELTDLFNARFNVKLSVSQISHALARNNLLSDNKSRKPANTLPVGSERTIRDGFILVKASDDPPVWKNKHVLVWEAANGPVPKDHLVIFGDGNKENFNLDNLILISKKEKSILYLKKLSQNDTDLTKAGIAVTNVLLKIAELKEKTYANKVKSAKICRLCGKPFNDDMFVLYCSRNCRDSAYKALTKQCLKIDRRLYDRCIVCEKPIEQNGKRGKAKIYCSRSCRHVRYKYLSLNAGKPELMKNSEADRLKGRG